MAPTLPSLTRRSRTVRKVASPKGTAFSRVTAGFKAHSDGDGYPGFSCIFRIEQTSGSRYDNNRSSKPQSRLSIGKRDARRAKETMFSWPAGCYCQASAGESDSDAESADEGTEDDACHSEHMVSEEPEDCKVEPSPASEDVLSNQAEEFSSNCDPSTSHVQESIEVIEVPATPDVADPSVEADASVPSDVLSVGPPTTAQEAERTLEILSQVPPDCQDPQETSPSTSSESSSTHSELNRLLESLDITKGSPTPECIPPNPEPQLGSKRPADVEWEDGPPTKKQRVETDIDNDANPPVLQPAMRVTLR